MTEIPKTIDHVPTAEELVANQPNGDAINLRDHAQLAEVNAAREALGYAPAVAPGIKPEVVVSGRTAEPAATGEPLTDIDRPVSRAELVEFRRQIAAEAGRTALRDMK